MPKLFGPHWVNIFEPLHTTVPSPKQYHLWSSQVLETYFDLVFGTLMNISAGSTYWALFKIFIPTSLILVLDSSKKRLLYSLDNRIMIFIPITQITQHSITSALHHSSEDYKTTAVIKVQENTHIRHLEYLPILHHQVQSRDTNIQPCNYGRTLTIHIRHNSCFINSFQTWS